MRDWVQSGNESEMRERQRKRRKRHREKLLGESARRSPESGGELERNHTEVLEDTDKDPADFETVYKGSSIAELNSELAQEFQAADRVRDRRQRYVEKVKELRSGENPESDRVDRMLDQIQRQDERLENIAVQNEARKRAINQKIAGLDDENALLDIHNDLNELTKNSPSERMTQELKRQKDLVEKRLQTVAAESNRGSKETDTADRPDTEGIKNRYGVDISGLDVEELKRLQDDIAEAVDQAAYSVEPASDIAELSVSDLRDSLQREAVDLVDALEMQNELAHNASESLTEQEKENIDKKVGLLQDYFQDNAEAISDPHTSEMARRFETDELLDFLGDAETDPAKNAFKSALSKLNS